MKTLKFVTQILLITLCVFCISAFAQDEPPAERSITPLDFKTKRKAPPRRGRVTPTNSNRRKAIATITNPKRRYKLVKRIPSNKIAFEPEELGVTFWRLRPVSKDDEGAPLFAVRLENNKVENWTAGRVASTTQFRQGDRVRFTVESPRSGWLYIVNREFYTDETSGKAKVIFPTSQTRGGNNRVESGSLIDVPPASEDFPYFDVNPKGENYAGEELIILILPNKLPNFVISREAQSVDPENLKKWFSDWQRTVDVYDAEDGADTAYTRDEAEAAKSASRDLTREEPLPQTVFRVHLKKDAPLLVTLRMQVTVP